MGIKVYKTKVPPKDLAAHAAEIFTDMVKGVVDLNQKCLALGGELHADCEKVLLEQGSKQDDLWGFNIYPDKNKEERLEYTSLINIRPKQGNFKIEIKDQQLRNAVKSIVDALID